MRRGSETEIDIENRAGSLSVVPRQDLDMESSPKLRRFLMQLLKKKDRYVTVNLGSVNRIDTSGLATLVEFALRLRNKGGSVAVFGLKEGATDTLSLQQVEGVLNLCSDAREAVELIEADIKRDENGIRNHG